MAFQAHLIIDGKTEFNAMESYYRMCPHEMSTTASFTYDLPTPNRIASITFEKLLQKMISLRSQAGASDNFVIVVHGLHDKSDFGWGLAMPMTDGAKMKASYEVMKPLLDLRDKGASQADLDKFEGEFKYTNESLGLFDVKFPPGSVSRLVDLMGKLQKLKVRIVELRACTLGTNKPGLEIVGRSFGARFILAPKVHMFYVHSDFTQKHNGFNPDPKTFASIAKLIPRARMFTNPANPAEKVQLGINRGAGVSFTPDVNVNTSNLKWFMNTQLWSINNYVDVTQIPKAPKKKPNDFFVEGMDLGGGRYALPSEQAYRDQLVEVGPLVGNLI